MSTICVPSARIMDRAAHYRKRLTRGLATDRVHAASIASFAVSLVMR